MSSNQGETKSGLAAPAVVIPHAPAVVIPQLNQAQSEALARGRTIGHYGHGVEASPFTLRQRHVRRDENTTWDEGGGALFTARTKGVLRGIHEVGQHRVAAAPVIRAIGRRNIPHIMIQNPRTGLPSRMGALGSTTEIPTFLSQRILGHGGPHTPISDLTKTSLGALSKRKGKTRKDPLARGGRRRKRRRTKRKSKHKKRHRRRKSTRKHKKNRKKRANRRR